MKDTKEIKPRITLQIDDEVQKLVINLRDKHHVNISAICREAIEEWHKKLESK